MPYSKLISSSITWNCHKLKSESSKLSVLTKSEHTKLDVSADAAQMTTYLLLTHVPSSTGHGEKMRCKSLWIKTKTGRSLIKTDSTWGKLVYCQLNRFGWSETQRTNETPSHRPAICFPRLNITSSLPALYLFSLEQCRETKNGVYGQSTTDSLCCSLRAHPPAPQGLYQGQSTTPVGISPALHPSFHSPLGAYNGTIDLQTK